MTKRIIFTVLAAAVGTFLGIGIVSKQFKDPLLKQIYNQQSQMLNLQKSLEGRLSQLETNLKPLIEVAKRTQEAQQRPRPQRPQEDFSKVYEIDVGHTPVNGDKEAPVQIVEFVDFQCPFCARFHFPMIEAAAAYPGKVSYMIKNFPLGFHQQARGAAKAAFAAGEQGKYWEMADLLLKNGRSLSDEKYIELAEELKLDVKKFKADMSSKDEEWEKYINADMELGSQVAVRGTPTFFINGKKTRARDVESFKQEIEKILNASEESEEK